MPPKLTVSQNVIDRLANVTQHCIGNLYGILHKNTLVIIGFNIENGTSSEFIHSLPTEIDLHGVLEVGDGLIDEDKVKQVMDDVDVTDTPIYMSCKVNEQHGNSIEIYYNINNKLHRTAFDVISEYDIYSQYVHIRLMTQLPFISGVEYEQIRESFLTLRKQITHGQVVFNFPKTCVYMMGSDSESGLVGLSGDPSVGEVCKESNGLSEGCNQNCEKKKGPPLEIDVLRVTMFRKVTRDIVTQDNVKMHAPVVQIDKKPRQSLMMTINIDALSIVHKDAKVVKLYAMLVESCCRYLRLLEAKLLANIHDCDDCINLTELETFHYFPDSCGHFITKTYIKNEDEEGLESERIALHNQLLLPTQYPLFRRANRFLFKGDVQGSDILLNPHEGIKPTGNDGEIATVRGKYSYYHYCQDKMDDNGWGCAYRSLQTLASWFRWQGYTDKDVPTFSDIQKCLVDIGDKPSSFIGSRQWIGSTEVNFVLNTLMNITSKILYVSSGEEMGSKGPELINHFKTQGTPVMIGGGVLAHTILGVDYNNITGIIKFLILDPHYTGSEDLAIIRKKGWCGWKDVEFWDKTAYYNMCLPQVPKCI